MAEMVEQYLCSGTVGVSPLLQKEGGTHILAQRNLPPQARESDDFAIAPKTPSMPLQLHPKHALKACVTQAIPFNHAGTCLRELRLKGRFTKWWMIIFVQVVT
jgi:hypothetical protein